MTGPLLLAGLGIGTLASQLGAVTVSAVPDSQSGEVGGVQNTVTNLGASIGTALSGAILIAVLTTTFLGSVAANPAIPKELSSKAQVELSAGIPFVSDADLNAALQKADVPPATADAVVDENAQSRINGLRAALAVLALIALVALALTRRLPTVQPGDEEPTTEELDAGTGLSGTAPAESGSAPPQRDTAPGPLRHEGQVMRWSKRPEGRHTPSGNWKMSRSSTPTCEVCRQRAHSTVKLPRSSGGCPTSWPGCRAREGRPNRAPACRRAAPRIGPLRSRPRLPRRRDPEQGPLAQRVGRPVAPRGGHVAQAVCMAS